MFSTEHEGRFVIKQQHTEKRKKHLSFQRFKKLQVNIVYSY